MSRRVIIILAVAIIVIVITAGYIGLSYLNNNQPSTDSPQAVRDLVMTTIATDYPATESLMADLSWTGGKQETGLLGSETYFYSSDAWTMQLKYPVIPNPTYDISANYSKDDISVEWAGTYQNGNVTEISCITYNLEITLPPQQQALYDVTGYIEENHPETSDFFRITSWSGGEVPNPERLVGSTTYKYIGIGWNVTIQYPVVPNPIYNINATYSSPQDTSGRIIVDWQGTWQNAVTTETKYTYNP